MKTLRNWSSEFTTRDLTLAAILIAIAGVFQTVWAHLIFDASMLGPFHPFFSALGFNVWSFMAVYLIRKPGSGTLVKTLAAVIELLLGNPVGPIVIFYGFAEGLGADIAFLLFRRKITLNMIIVGSLIAHFTTLPVDMYRDAILFNLDAIIAYTGTTVIGKAWIGWLVYHLLRLAFRAGIRPSPEYWEKDFRPEQVSKS